MEKWIVVANNGKKRLPSVADAIYIAEVINFDKFNRRLLSTGEYAYKLASYKKYFSNRFDLGSMRTTSF